MPSEHWVDFPVLYSRFPLVVYFIYSSGYMPTSVSQFMPPPSPLVSIHLFSMSVSLFLPCKQVYLYHFSRFHIYALINNICFSLSNLLQSVWHSLGSSASLQMTQWASPKGLVTDPNCIISRWQSWGSNPGNLASKSKSNHSAILTSMSLTFKSGFFCYFLKTQLSKVS